MLPIGVCWEARLGKGRYLIDVLLRDGVVADGVAQMGDVIEVEITKLVFYNRVKFFFLVEGEDDDVFSEENPFILGQVSTDIMHRIVEDSIDDLQVFFFPFFIYNNVVVILRDRLAVCFQQRFFPIGSE